MIKPGLSAERLAELRSRVVPEEPVQPVQCATCQDTRWTVNDQGRAARCTACQPTYAPNVPLEFREARMASYATMHGNQKAIEAAYAFLNGSPRDLYLFGGIGTGKTRLACTILNEQPMHGYFVRAVQLLHDLQPSDDDTERRYGFEVRLRTIPVLVIDDLGAERDVATDYTRRTLLMLYEQRHDAGRRTIWTSNKSLEQLSDMLDDERLVSRIYGRSVVVELTTPDQRHARR